MIKKFVLNRGLLFWFVLPVTFSLFISGCTHSQIVKNNQANEKYISYLRDNFYFVNIQDFSEIQCRLRSDFLDMFVERTREAVNKKLVIQYRPETFSIRYFKEETPKIGKPFFHVKLAGNKKPDAFEQEGLKKMEENFAKIVQSVKGSLLKYMNFYRVIDNKRLLNLDFRTTKTGYYAKYETKGDAKITEKFANQKLNVHFFHQKKRIDIQATFIDALNKKLLDTIRIDLTEPNGSVFEENIEIRYQTLRPKFIFPKEFVVDARSMLANGTIQNFEYDMEITDCKIR